MTKRRALVWFRQDLRLHDNEALLEALDHAIEVVPVFVFDERTFFGNTSFGFRKTGNFRAQFIIESVQDLRKSLRGLSSDLIVRVGKPEEEIFKIARAAKSSWVFCNRERTYEEVKVQDALEKNLWSIGQEMRYSRGKMLYHTSDLPFPIQHVPDVFSQFRKEVERFVQVRDPLPRPFKPFAQLTFDVDPGTIPTLEDLDHESFKPDPRAVLHFKGGETEGLRRLKYYVEETDLIKTYKETRNGLIGGDFSSKLAPWLAQGCLSPKLIYQEIKKYEAQKGSNKSTYWLIFELIWRDFFRFIAKKYGNRIFLPGGTKGQVQAGLRNDTSLLQRWVDAQTGVPFIDANMTELKQTGYMSNRGRQNVASFLVKDLSVNWQMGAEYFESMLIDYDVTSNWGNWNYVAGVGSDPRENRYFNILSQAQRYDPDGAYVKLWLPELRDLPADKVHQPDALSNAEQQAHNLKLGADYPEAMVKTQKWMKGRRPSRG